MIAKYKETLQDTTFDIKCLGMQQNLKGNKVFYLVVESKDISDIRDELYQMVKDSKKLNIPFHPTKKYDPHITVGFIGGDVHNVSKSVDTCVAEVELY